MLHPGVFTAVWPVRASVANAVRYTAPPCRNQTFLTPVSTSPGGANSLELAPLLQSLWICSRARILTSRRPLHTPIFNRNWLKVCPHVRRSQPTRQTAQGQWQGRGARFPPMHVGIITNTAHSAFIVKTALLQIEKTSYGGTPTAQPRASNDDFSACAKGSVGVTGAAHPTMPRREGWPCIHK